jgi:tetratricopeptide (TPR) repeat protein
VTECEKIGDSPNLALALNNLGMVYNLSKRHGDAQKTFARVLELQRIINNPWGIVMANANLGVTAFYRRDYAQAEQLYTQTLGLARTHDFQEFELETLYNLSEVQLALGNAAQARTTLHELESHQLSDAIKQDVLTLNRAIDHALSNPNARATEGG